MMGLSQNNNSNEELQLCVFDTRRGQQEGQEIDKILFFYPPNFSLTSQLSVIGLSEGIITFTGIFSPEAPCEVIEADKHSYIFYQPEADIWMVLVIEKVKESDELCRHEALRAILKEAHSLFTMFYGPIRPLLEKQPDATSVRDFLHVFLSDYLSDFIVGKKIKLPSFRESLVERGTVQMLSMKRETALEVQSLVRLLESPLTGNLVRNSLILFHDLLVATTLYPEDTVNLYTYAARRLTPNAIAVGTNSRTYARSMTLAAPEPVSSGLVSLFPYEADLTGYITSSGHQNQKVYVPRPFQRDRWWKENDGFIVTDLWGSDVNVGHVKTPTIWLQQREERMQMCVYQKNSLTLIMLVPLETSNNMMHDMSILKQQILENALLKIIKLEERLTKEWGGVNANHVAGYRYLYCDHDRKLSKASPPGKVATLSKNSLVALSKLRAEVDLIKKRSNIEKETPGRDLEVCTRIKNNTWIICRINGEHELYMVLEKASETLLYASDAVDKFSKGYCNGVFCSD
eukprot:TRINITY_DN1181_c0_g1_i1.p1 TRINITY_DN1181_c0_g1~~TRINITY_DN1181_c0_g1_i1.p1  ORF type:complete len:516 (+),score=102.53 TRINITY_DN1181_c0_g1_i1:312-1859(+)